jgi:hypothetical protein
MGCLGSRGVAAARGRRCHARLRVSVDTIDLEVRQPIYQGNSWAWWIAAWSLAMIVSTGRPKLRESSSFWSARGSAGGAVAQAIAGLIAIDPRC